MAHSSSSIPSLPAETWHMVLANVKDPRHLWTICRTVCVCWRAEVPKIFASDILQEPDMVQLSFNYGYDDDNVETVLGFSRFDPDNPQWCVFAELDSSKKQPTVKRKRSHHHSVRPVSADSRWDQIKHRMAEYLEGVEVHNSDKFSAFDLLSSDADGFRIQDVPFDRVIDNCPYWLRVHRNIDDVLFPGVRFDPDRREIRFDWYAMFREFYRLKEEVDRRVCAAMNAQKLQLPLDNLNLENGLVWALRLQEEIEKQEEEVREDRNQRLFEQTEDSVRGCTEYEIFGPYNRYRQKKLQDARDAWP